MFYLTTHSTHFIYGYMASDIRLRTILIVREETRCRHIGYSYRLTARVLLYASSHRQDNTYHGLCYTSRGALAGTRNIQYAVKYCKILQFRGCHKGIGNQSLPTLLATILEDKVLTPIGEVTWYTAPSGDGCGRLRVS